MSVCEVYIIYASCNQFGLACRLVSDFCILCITLGDESTRAEANA